MVFGGALALLQTRSHSQTRTRTPLPLGYGSRCGVVDAVQEVEGGRCIVLRACFGRCGALASLAIEGTRNQDSGSGLAPALGVSAGHAWAASAALGRMRQGRGPVARTAACNWGSLEIDRRGSC